MYADLERRFGAEGARKYARANQAAIDKIRSLVQELGIDCDLETKANYAYSESAESVPQIKAEVAAAKRAGLPSGLRNGTAASFPRGRRDPRRRSGAVSSPQKPPAPRTAGRRRGQLRL
jgi:hypothetical protein